MSIAACVSALIASASSSCSSLEKSEYVSDRLTNQLTDPLRLEPFLQRLLDPCAPVVLLLRFSSLRSFEPRTVDSRVARDELYELCGPVGTDHRCQNFWISLEDGIG